MVGVGWLVVMDDWLLRGGALGAIPGFAIGGGLLLPIGYVYDRKGAGLPNVCPVYSAGSVALSQNITVSVQPASPRRQSARRAAR